MIPALAIGTAWVIVACAIAPKLGRAMKAADPGEDQPASWTDLIPADSLSDGDLMRERFDAIVGAEVWFGGALHYTGHQDGAL